MNKLKSLTLAAIFTVSAGAQAETELWINFQNPHSDMILMTDYTNGYLCEILRDLRNKTFKDLGIGGYHYCRKI